MDLPETRYARNGEVYLAYQDFGAGDHTLVCCGPIFSHLDVFWERPDNRRYMERLASFARVVMFDKRGQGLSDRDVGVPTFEDRVDDIGAVMDAAGLERAVVGGVSEGGAAALAFAAAHPQRAESLILLGVPVRQIRRDDYEVGVVPEAWDAVAGHMAEHWGTAESIVGNVFTPSMASDPDYQRFMQRYERACCTPPVIRRHLDWIREVDLVPLAPLVQCPTLIMHSSDDLAVSVESAHLLNELIPESVLRIFDSPDHPPWFAAQDEYLAAHEEFLLGERLVQEPDRVLATVLFTDIAGSTEQASKLGDAAWRDLLDRHDEAASDHVERFGGRRVKSTGDGLLATFDGPGRAVRCAAALSESLGRIGITIRAGLHTGEVELRGGDIGGIAVHLAARVESLAEPGEVLVSRTVVDLTVGSEIVYCDRGEHELKGIPGRWPLFAAALGA